MKNERYERDAEAQALLAELQHFKQTKLYEALLKPLEEQLELLKHAYDCTTTEEIAELRGKKYGLSFFQETINNIVRNGELANEAEQNAKARKERESMEIDSTEL